MSGFRTEEYYKRFIELQEKLRKSEEERLKLEMKFNEMVRVTREEEQMHYRKLRAQYKRFLEEDRRRQDRNERILRTLERIESRVAMLVAKTERFKLLRQQYQTFLDRVYANNQVKTVEVQKSEPKEPTRVDDKNDIVQTYLQSLSSNKLREMLKKEENARLTTDPEDKHCYSDLYFGGGDSKPNYANTIADDIMNSIYLKRADDGRLKESREFNNNTLTPKLTKRFSSDDDNRRIASRAENTETDDFSESDEILYKNPTEFNKALLKNSEKLGSSRSIDDAARAATNEAQPSSTKDIVTSEDKKASIDDDIKTDIGKSTKETSLDVVDSVETPKEIPEDQNEIIQPLQESVLNLQETEVKTTPAVVEHDGEPQPEALESKKLEETPVQEKITNDKPLEQPSLSFETIKSDENPVEVMQPTQQIDDQSHVLQYPNQEYDQTVQPCDQNQYLQSNQPLAEYDAQQFEQGPPIQQTYDESGQPIQQYADYNQYLQQYDENAEYNKHGQLIQQYDEDGQLIQRYNNGDGKIQAQYDEKGQMIQQYDEFGQSIQQYDETGQLIQQYDENGQPIHQQYDENGQLIQQYDETGQLIQQNDENGQLIQQYDQSGQLFQQYDQSGLPIQQYDESVQPIQQYDESGQPIQQYDGSGQLIQQYEERRQPIQQYDGTGQPIQQYNEPKQPNQQYDETTQLIQQQYDESGQPIQQYDESGQPIQQYDESGQQIQQYDGSGQPIQQYEEYGQPIQQYDQTGQPIQQYDENGQPIQQYEDQYYMQQYYQNVEESGEKLPEIVSAPHEISNAQNKVVKEDDVKKPSNVMEMLDTDTESVKQDTKMSHDSDFDFSNE